MAAAEQTRFHRFGLRPEKLSSLYAILDRETLDARKMTVRSYAEELRDAGARLVQYRDKINGPQEILRTARAISEVFAGIEATLILNDRADLAELLGWGVHVGQGDLPIEAARRVVGNAIAGISTHSEEQVMAADLTSADYVAIGPVFATATKHDAEPVVGLEGIRRARELTAKPLVAIGGITMENAQQVREAGAHSLAVISGLIQPGKRVAEIVRQFQGSR